VNVAATRLVRAGTTRRFLTFPNLAVAAAGMLVVIVATGATVRLTASGLGCQHWPGCQPGDPFPAKGYHSYIEFSNRVVAFFTIVATLGAWTAANLSRTTPPWLQGLAGWVFIGTLGQAPLGAITVYYHLNPYLVLSHLLLSFVVLGLAVVVAIEALRLGRGGAASPPRIVRIAGIVALVALCALVVSGTFVTASGPHPGSGDVHRLGVFSRAIWLHVRATAVFGLLFLALIGWAARERRRRPAALPAAAILLVLLLAQMAIGEVQYRTRLPWWLVLTHVSVAAAVWATAVALVALLWRPIALRRLR
jgi:heme a synthase